MGPSAVRESQRPEVGTVCRCADRSTCGGAATRHQAAVPGAERQSRTQSSDRWRGILESVGICRVRAGRRSRTGLGAPLQSLALLHGAQWPHPGRVRSESSCRVTRCPENWGKISRLQTTADKFCFLYGRNRIHRLSMGQCLDESDQERTVAHWGRRQRCEPRHPNREPSSASHD